MLFHYVNGSLMCEIRIKGLTTRVGGWTVHNLWSDRDYRSPYADEDLIRIDEPEDYYGGYKQFVCESLSRAAAQRIVDGLGGYMVSEFAVPPARQLGDGGPFFVHSFDTTCPRYISMYARVEMAIDRAERSKDFPEYSGVFRIYDNSGCLVTEIQR